jgi:hypothetical protein
MYVYAGAGHEDGGDAPPEHLGAGVVQGINVVVGQGERLAPVGPDWTLLFSCTRTDSWRAVQARMQGQ